MCASSAFTPDTSGLPSNSLRIVTAASSAALSPLLQASWQRSALRLAVAEMQPAKAPARASSSTASVEGKHVEAFRDRRGLARIVHVAGGILQADDAAAERVEQALHQRDVPVQAGLLRVVIEIDRDRLLRRRLHDGVDIGDEAVVRHALVVERRQHQRAGKAKLGGVPRQRHRVGDRRRRRCRPSCGRAAARRRDRRPSRACARRARTRSPRRWCRAR